MRSKKPLTQQRIKSISRIYYANIASGERYYLRVLLIVTLGATSYIDLYTFKGIVYNTFRQCYIARGLANNNKEQDKALTKARDQQSNKVLRGIFIIRLRDKGITDAGALQAKFKANLGDSKTLRSL